MFWCNVYRVNLMNRIDRHDKDAENKYIQIEKKKAEVEGRDWKYVESGRFIREQLVPDMRHPIYVDMILPSVLVRTNAVEVGLRTPEPYWRDEATKLYRHGNRESHANRAECLEQVNFALDMKYPDIGVLRDTMGRRVFVDTFQFDKLVFVRLRLASLAETLRYLRLCRARYAQVGLRVDVTIRQIQLFIASTHDESPTDWQSFFRDAVPHIRKNGLKNLVDWLTVKRKKLPTKV